MKILLTPILFLISSTLFSQNLISDCDENGLYGYINDFGDWIIEPQYQYANDFYEGLGFVSFGDKYGFINEKNEIIFSAPKDTNNDFTSNYSDGYALVKINGKYGFIDSSGNIAIEPIYSKAMSFSEGLAAVSLNVLSGYIDKKGNTIIPFNHLLVYSFSDGLAITESGYIDKSDKIIIESKYEFESPFSEGLAAVKHKDKWGYIDKKSNIIIPIHYEHVMRFSNGLAGFKQNNRYGFFDKNGRIIITPMFDEVYCFENGLAWVKFRGKYLLTSKTGELFTNKRSYYRKYANAEKRLKNFVIREIEKWQIKGEFESTAQYIKRVNDTIRQKKAKELFEEKLKSLYFEESERIKITDFTLGNYDADNQTFLIESKKYGKIILPVKHEKAKEFKDNWANVRLLNPELNLLADKFQILKLDFIIVPKGIKRHFRLSDGKDVTIESKDMNVFLENYNFQYEYITYVLPNSKETDTIDVPTNLIKGFLKEYPKAKPCFNYSLYPKDNTFTFNSIVKSNYAYKDLKIKFSPLEFEILPSQTINQDLMIESSEISDVDNNIPKSNSTNDKTFVIIISNENYQKEVSVLYAVNDGKIFKEYCEKTLCIPPKNIHFIQNATFGNMKSEINWIINVLSAYNGQAKAIIYYSGHGMPNEKDKSALLLPIDGSSSDSETAIKLDDLYTKLSSVPSKNVTIFLDACFSGSIREEGMLMSSRGVRIKPKESLIADNLIIFSASTGAETAYPYKEKRHGLFSYFLLKKLQESKGDVDYYTLSNYIIENVKQHSIVVNKKPQTPQINVAQNLISKWKSFKLND